MFLIKTVSKKTSMYNSKKYPFMRLSSNTPIEELIDEDILNSIVINKYKKNIILTSDEN
jgi:hypothetical protein